MKNSSRLLEKIDRNLMRSISGWSVRSASSSTRSLKESQDSSRWVRCGSDLGDDFDRDAIGFLKEVGFGSKRQVFQS